MAGKPKTAERLAVIETTLKYVQEGIDDLKDMVTKNGVARNNLEKQVVDMKNFCDDVQKEKLHNLSGRDKAIILGAFATGLFALLAEVVRIIFN